MNNDLELLDSYRNVLCKSKRAMSMTNTKCVGLFLKKVRHKIETQSDQHHFITEHQDSGKIIEDLGLIIEDLGPINEDLDLINEDLDLVKET
jgi:hypothetical protein